MVRPHATLADDLRIMRPTAPVEEDTSPPRRRTLGLCAHCRKPVDVKDDYVRLYRRAWHLNCALASEPQPDRSFD